MREPCDTMLPHPLWSCCSFVERLREESAVACEGSAAVRPGPLLPLRAAVAPSSSYNLASPSLRSLPDHQPPCPSFPSIALGRTSERLPAMAPPGIDLITTVASRLYALAPAPPPGLRFHSAPLPSPATSTEEGGSSSSPPRAEYPFGRETGQSVGDSTGTDAGSDRASGASAGRPEPTRVAGSSTTVIGGSGASNGSPWDDDGGDVSSEGTARQRSTERPGGKSDAYGRAPARSPTAASAAATHPTTVDDDYARHRWRPTSSHGSRASSFKSVQDGLAKAERDAEERDEVRALAADGDDGDDDDAGSDDSGESDDDCVVLVQSRSPSLFNQSPGPQVDNCSYRLTQRPTTSSCAITRSFPCFRSLRSPASSPR
jgi:hypothetical protein